MFEKCITCGKIGDSCVPNLWLLHFPDLLQWCVKRQKFLGWTNQDWSDKSTVPVGTINRIKGGEYMDCKYSTIKSLAIALIGGTSDEFPCNEQVEKELQNLERFERQAARLSEVEAENARFKARFAQIDEQHRQDIRAVKAEYMEEIIFLRDELKAWRCWHQRPEP